ncbi:unnamed protein product [Auanema sp. JU1783]|nr:unnamed protein product [Auanema sp. JU1783]
MHLPQRRPSQTSMLKRALSFQLLNRDDEFIEPEVRDYIKMRYKDTSKFIIWKSCHFEPPLREDHENEEAERPIRKEVKPTDPRAILFQADMEDEKTPYLPATINSVLRSDSEDSSSDESVIYMTR